MPKFNSLKDIVKDGKIDDIKIIDKPKYTLEEIPKDVVEHVIGPFLGILPDSEKDKTFSALARTSKNVNILFKKPCEENIFTQLLLAIIDDNREIVKSILDIHPELLLKKGPKNPIQADGYRKYCLEGQPVLQIALFRCNYKETFNLVLSYFEKQKDGINEALKQWEAYEVNKKITKKDIQEGIEYTKEVIKKIINGTFSKSDFNQKIDAKIFLPAAYKAYYMCFTDFQNEDQRNTFLNDFIQLLYDAYYHKGVLRSLNFQRAEISQVCFNVGGTSAIPSF